MTNVPYIAFLVLFLATLALRMRRELNFDRVGSLRFRLRLYTLPVIALLVSFIVARQSVSLLIMTWALSLSLVVYSLKTSVFEHRPDGFWFRKNPWVSVAVLTLFVGRLVYRSWVFMGAVDSAPHSAAEMSDYWVRTPFSLMTLLLLTSYNGFYYLAVYRRARQNRV